MENKDSLGDISNNFHISEEILEIDYLLCDMPAPPNVARLIIWLIEKYPHQLIEELLARGFPWPHDLPFDESVFVSQDDTDCHISGFWIGTSRDADKWLEFETQAFDDKKRLAMSNSLRFRNGMIGGTSSPRMNPALRILLMACLKDKRSTDGYIIDPETGRPLGWGEMREMQRPHE